MFELWVLVEGLNRTLSGKFTCVAELFDVELIRTRSIITAALLESQATVCNVACLMHEGFLV